MLGGGLRASMPSGMTLHNLDYTGPYCMAGFEFLVMIAYVNGALALTRTLLASFGGKEFDAVPALLFGGIHAYIGFAQKI